jgi:hypothetical protein
MKKLSFSPSQQSHGLVEKIHDKPLLNLLI